MKIGIDIGGTTISVGLVHNGVIADSYTGPSFEPDASLDQTISHLCTFIDRFFGPGVDSIGIGVPSVVDADFGIVYDTANIPSWKEVPLKDILESKYGVKVSVNNDANCFALGAAVATGCRMDEILVGITLGTGLGVGIVAGGKLFNGSNTGAGELFWLPYKGDTIEHWCSKQFFEARGISPRILADRAAAGDSEALAIFEEFGINLGTFANVVLSAYDPDRLVFGGGLTHTARYFEPAMKATMARKFPYPKSLERLTISYITDSNVAILGASML